MYLLVPLSPMDSSHPYFLAIHPSNSALLISLPLRKEIWKLPIEEEMGSEKGHLVFSDANKGLTFPKGSFSELSIVDNLKANLRNCFRYRREFIAGGWKKIGPVG
jgi:hypothetical protein